MNLNDYFNYLIREYGFLFIRESYPSATFNEKALSKDKAFLFGQKIEI